MSRDLSSGSFGRAHRELHSHLPSGDGDPLDRRPVADLGHRHVRGLGVDVAEDGELPELARVAAVHRHRHHRVGGGVAGRLADGARPLQRDHYPVLAGEEPAGQRDRVATTVVRLLRAAQRGGLQLLAGQRLRLDRRQQGLAHR
ncbi:hypothetical protein [Micromonospora sp. NPDC057141]|uniref:hypothetical protein n=1 Tax=Micromonospora sp. NPDC057141 TaxID=3346033 RepID=UPI003633B8BF